MDGWTDELLLLCLATSSRSHLFADVPLLSASPYLPHLLLQLPRPNLSLRAADTLRLATSSSNPAENKNSTMIKNFSQLLQCVEQSAIPHGRAVATVMLSRAANAFCPSQLQPRIAGASRQIEQRWCSVNSAGFTTQIRGWSARLFFLYGFVCPTL